MILSNSRRCFSYKVRPDGLPSGGASAGGSLTGSDLFSFSLRFLPVAAVFLEFVELDFFVVTACCEFCLGFFSLFLEDAEAPFFFSAVVDFFFDAVDVLAFLEEDCLSFLDVVDLAMKVKALAVDFFSVFVDDSLSGFRFRSVAGGENGGGGALLRRRLASVIPSLAAVVWTRCSRGTRGVLPPNTQSTTNSPSFSVAMRPRASSRSLRRLSALAPLNQEEEERATAMSVRKPKRNAFHGAVSPQFINTYTSETRTKSPLRSGRVLGFLSRGEVGGDADTAVGTGSDVWQSVMMEPRKKKMSNALPKSSASRLSPHASPSDNFFLARRRLSYCFHTSDDKHSR